MILSTVNGVARRAEKTGMRGYCPDCMGEMISVCGDKKINHWRHKKSCTNPDTWKGSEGETEWHLLHKQIMGELCDKSNVSYEVEKRFDKTDTEGHAHRTDFFTNGVCIEFQNSPITQEEVSVREDYYNDMIWVFSEKPRLQFTKPVFYYENNNLYGLMNYKSHVMCDQDTLETINVYKELAEEENDPTYLIHLKSYKEEIESYEKYSIKEDYQNTFVAESCIDIIESIKHYPEMQLCIVKKNISDLIKEKTREIDSLGMLYKGYTNEKYYPVVEEKLIELQGEIDKASNERDARVEDLIKERNTLDERKSKLSKIKNEIQIKERKQLYLKAAANAEAYPNGISEKDIQDSIRNSKVWAVYSKEYERFLEREEYYKNELQMGNVENTYQEKMKKIRYHAIYLCVKEREEEIEKLRRDHEAI